MSPRTQFCIPGLPEGIRVVRYGQEQEDDEYIFTGSSIQKGGTGLVVTLEPGWSQQWDEAHARMVLARDFDEPKRVTLLIRNSTEEHWLDRLLKTGQLTAEKG